MERVIIEFENLKDRELLEFLANRIGFKIFPYDEFPNQKKKYAKKLLEKGCDISNFGDPIEWQKAEREERKLF